MAKQNNSSRKETPYLPGSTYTYAARPDSYYKKDDKGQWLISNKGTGDKFIPIQDPNGTRAKVLNEQAKVNVPITNSPYALAASNFANNKGTDSKQAYIDMYQKLPELEKNAKYNFKFPDNYPTVKATPKKQEVGFKQQVSNTLDNLIYHPFTSAELLMNGQGIPTDETLDNQFKNKTYGYYKNGAFRNERSPLDNHVTDNTPIGWVHSAAKVADRATNNIDGDFYTKENAWDAAQIIPGFKYLRPGMKAVNSGLKILNPLKTTTRGVLLNTAEKAFADGGPLNDINNGQYLNSVYASALGNYYRQGGQFPIPYSLPEDSFKQGGNNLHNSVYASSPAQYPAPYALGGYIGESTRQQMYMPLDHVTKNGGSILSMSNTPQLEGEGKDLSEPKNSYIYNQGGPLNNHIMENGSKIHINPANRGKFTASAQHAGMGVQAFANHVLANKEDYSSTQVKRANFAHIAAGWNHQYGGNMYANGGPLTEFNEGGTHEENPLGGIPQGMAPDGGMNLVEQGETKLDSANYIFSDTLKVDKETAAGLGLNNAVGKTFAELSKKMNRPNSRRENDTIEENAKKRDLDSLMQAQEEFKQKEAAKKLEEIQSLDPNLLGSLMGQGQPVEPQQDPNLMQQPMGSEQPGGQPPVDPAMQQMMAQQGGSLGGIVPMAMGGSLQHSYGLGGFGDVMRNYGLGMADTALSTLGAKNVVQDSAYKGQGSEFMRKASGIAGGIGGALLPMAANIVAPGMGGMIAGAAQQGIGMLDPEDERAKQLRMGDNNQNGVNQQQGLPIGTNYKTGGHMYAVGGYPQLTPGTISYIKQDPIGKLPLRSYAPLTLNAESSKTLQNPLSFQAPDVVDDGLGLEYFQGDSPEAIAEYEKFGMVKNENGDWVDRNPTPEERPFTNESDEQYSINELDNQLVQNPETGMYEYRSGKADADVHAKDATQKEIEAMNLKQSGLNALGTYTPAAYNIGMGLFSKPQQLNANDYYTKANIKPWEYNADPELAAVREAYAGASAGLKNTMPGAGAYLTNRANLANQEAMSKKQVLANKQNFDAQNYMQAQLANKQYEANNQQTKLAIADWNAKSKAAKRNYLQAGLGQIGQIAQSDTANQLGLAYAKMNAPDMGEKFNYTGWAQARSAAIKAKQDASKQGK